MSTAGDGTEGSLPPAGWYPDAANPGRERLWTGERWIDWIRPAKAGRVEATPTGWYPDAGHPGFERLWSGEMWTEEIRRAGVASVAPAPRPVTVGATETSTPAAGPSPAQPGQMPPQPLPSTIVTYYDDNPPYRLGGLANLLTVAFVVAILSAVVEAIYDQIYIGIENDIIDGNLPSLSRVHSITDGANVTHVITLIAFGIVAIIFVIWFHRAYRNLVRAGISDLRFGPGWAIGGWFIPIFNLFRQKAIANDIWKASASAGTVGLPRRREMPLSGVLNWWWGVWIAAGLVGIVANARVRHAHSVRAETGPGSILLSGNLHSLRLERAGVWTSQVGVVLAIVAAVLAVLFVREVSRLQDDHFEARVPGTY